LAEKMGLRTAYQLQMAMNIPPNTASRWWKNEELKHIDSASLERLCDFFTCEPGDIIKRVKNGRSAAAKTSRRTARS
jgi:DNA-binding Xre family transcriptional regulator